MVKLRAAAHSPVSRASTEALSRASTKEQLLELRRRILAPRPRRYDTWGDLGPPARAWSGHGAAAWWSGAG